MGAPLPLPLLLLRPVFRADSGAGSGRADELGRPGAASHIQRPPPRGETRRRPAQRPGRSAFPVGGEPTRRPASAASAVLRHPELVEATEPPAAGDATDRRHRAARGSLEFGIMSTFREVGCQFFPQAVAGNAKGRVDVGLCDAEQCSTADRPPGWQTAMPTTDFASPAGRVHSIRSIGPSARLPSSIPIRPEASCKYKKGIFRIS